MTENHQHKSPKPSLSFDQALAKLQKYCAYQDRCHQEVRYKLLRLKVYGDTLEDVISHLIQDNYLDEERFARSFVRGKYRMKKWGAEKILQELKKREISTYCIKKGMEEIDEEEYHNNLQSLLNKLKEKHDIQNYSEKQKVLASLKRKGYSFEDIYALIN